MLSLLFTIPLFPLLGFLALTILGGRLTQRESSRIGVGSMGLSALATLLVAYSFITNPPESHAFIQKLWTWISVGDLSVDFAFRLDALSLTMMLVVTLVGFLIHWYSTGYMAGDAQYTRFFACMNLFCAAMLVLVMADNLLLLFLGWEGVGLCSYLLIGFWYQDPANTRAANKAFLVTRVGDLFMMIGLLLIFTQLGTLHIQTVLERAPEVWAEGAPVAILAAFLLLMGAIGKSGQLPLQVWLPDAMAGPTPVSALIHAATMVTAGVYLIARTNVLFTLAPPVQALVAIIGALTLLIAGVCALFQSDIKRVLAYSTISQVGYMFLALGVGAWSAGLFHFATHAIFKALLFMAAGTIIVALHHEQNIFHMGGLRKRLPLVYRTFLIGALSLTAVPLISAGFYSKDMILWEVWISDKGGFWLWLAGFVGAFLTSVYTFRMVIIVFFGDERGHMEHKPGSALTRPLVILAIGATVAGFLEIPRTLGGVYTFSHFMHHTLPALHGTHPPVAVEWFMQIIAAIAVFAGILFAWLVWAGKPVVQPAPSALRSFAAGGLGFDALYRVFIVIPYTGIAAINKGDIFTLPMSLFTFSIESSARALRSTQSGRVRWYVAAMAVGAVLAVYLVAYK